MMNTFPVNRTYLGVQIAGTLFILLLGVTTAAALLFGMLWLLSQLALAVVASLVVSCQAIGTLYGSADSFSRLLLLAGIAYALYRASRAISRRIHR